MRNSVCEFDLSTQEGRKITQSIPKSHPISPAQGEQGSGSELLDSARFSRCLHTVVITKSFLSLSSHILLFKCIARGSDSDRLSSLLYIGMYRYTYVLLTLQVHHCPLPQPGTHSFQGLKRTMIESNFPAP